MVYKLFQRKCLQRFKNGPVFQEIKYTHFYLILLEYLMNYKVVSILQKPVRKYGLLPPDIVVAYLRFLRTD